MTRNTISCLLLHILILCCAYKVIIAADEDNAFTLVFGSESSLQDVQKEVSDAKQTLADAVISTSHLNEDYDSFVKRFDKIENALSKQNDNLLRKLETFIEDSIAVQSTELSQQLMAEPKWLQDQMSVQLNSFISELQMSENKLLDEIKQNVG